MTSEEPKSDELYPELIAKLNGIVLDQERIAKQLNQLSKEMQIVKKFEEAIDRTIKNVSNSQTATVERLEHTAHLMTKIQSEQNRVTVLQNDFRIELTNKAFLQNEIIKELQSLSRFVMSGQLHSTQIRLKLKEVEKEMAIIGFSQNQFSDHLDVFKNEVQGVLNELKQQAENHLLLESTAFDEQLTQKLHNNHKKPIKSAENPISKPLEDNSKQHKREKPEPDPGRPPSELNSDK